MVMKIWLPDSLYRAKPLLIMLFGAMLLYLTDHIILAIFAFLCLGYGSWIIVMRVMWSDTGIVISCFGTSHSGRAKTLNVNPSENR